MVSSSVSGLTLDSAVFRRTRPDGQMLLSVVFARIFGSLRAGLILAMAEGRGTAINFQALYFQGLSHRHKTAVSGPVSDISGPWKIDGYGAPNWKVTL
jgi:hypothetical protein